METKRKPYRRCRDCGRFTKGGMWNYILHKARECPISYTVAQGEFKKTNQTKKL